MIYQENQIRQFQTIFGYNLLSEIEFFVAEPFLLVTMEDLWQKYESKFNINSEYLYFVNSLEIKDLDKDAKKFENIKSIIGFGGGQAMDVAKFLNWKTNSKLYQFPSSLSVDAVFGHRAGVREDSNVKYLGWAVPEAIYIDFDILKSCPKHLNTGGLGDVLCFYTGIFDWEYAHRIGKCEEKWAYNQSLADISKSKADNVVNNIDDVCELTDNGIQFLVDALKWGGASFHGAGWNPRHIEGVEHFFFYALESYTKKKFLHGQAVCLGVVIGCMMHQKKEDELLGIIHQAGIDIRPEAMGIEWEDVEKTLYSLKNYVKENKFHYGIANDFEVTKEFFQSVKNKVESKFNK